MVSNFVERPRTRILYLVPWKAGLCHGFAFSLYQFVHYFRTPLQGGFLRLPVFSHLQNIIFLRIFWNPLEVYSRYTNQRSYLELKSSSIFIFWFPHLPTYYNAVHILTMFHIDFRLVLVGYWSSNMRCKLITPLNIHTYILY